MVCPAVCAAAAVQARLTPSHFTLALLHPPHLPIRPPADAQPSSFQLSLGRLQPGASGFVEVLNPNSFAVDVSGYALRGAVSFEFAPGE